MVDRLVQYSSAGFYTVAGTLIVFLVGCQDLPKSTWPVTARGAQPTIEPDSAPNPARVQKVLLPATGSVRAKIIPVAASSPASDSDADGNSWFSEMRPILQPGFAGGLATPLDRSGVDVEPGAEAGGGFLDNPTNSNAPRGIFGAGAEGDDAPFDNADADFEQQPVQPIEERISFKDDIVGLPSMLWNDAKSIVTWPNAVVLGAAAGGALIIRDDLDQRVRHETAEHPLRWGQGSVVLRQFGEYSYQVPVLAGVYGLSLWIEDDRLHEFSTAVLSAYGLTAMSTVAIKGVTNTSRPTTEFQGGHYGFPSYHAASTFTIAAVIDEYYGWQWGLPAYALAGLVGWSRIDQREHDLSDVFFGSVLGFVIGKTVAAAHLDRKANMKITPYYDAQNRAAWVSFEKRY